MVRALDGTVGLPLVPADEQERHQNHHDHGGKAGSNYGKWLSHGYFRAALKLHTLRSVADVTVTLIDEGVNFHRLLDGVTR